MIGTLMRMVCVVGVVAALGAGCGAVEWEAVAVESLPEAYQSSIAASDFPAHPFYVLASDGTPLFCLAWILPGKEETPSAVVLDRTPYEMGLNQLADLWLPFGFVALGCEQRGTGLSGGKWSTWHTSAGDAESIMDFVAEQPWFNGMIMNEGFSADGILAITSLLDPHPYVKGMFTGWTTGKSHPLVFQNGNYRESLVSWWLNGIHKQRPDAVDYVTTMLEHEAFDSWWQEITMANFSTVTIPMIHYAGQEDIFLQHQLDTYADIQAFGGPGAKGKQRLIIGADGHCSLQSHDKRPHAEMAEIWAVEMATALFVELQGEPASWPKLNTVTIYILGANTTGAPGDYWTTLPDFPAPTAVTYALAPGGVLAEPGTPAPPPANITYVFDPANPVPTIGGNNLNLPCGERAQNAVEGRDDVLVFTSAALTAPLPIAGRMVATLYVASDRNDTDFTVKVTDVFPDGASILVTDDVIRMRWRETPEAPVAMVPGTVYRIQIEMWFKAYIFNAGHKLRFAVSSSNAPRFSVNPNTGLPIIDFDPKHMLVAHNTLFLGGTDHPSSLTLPVVSMDQIPANVVPI